MDLSGLGETIRADPRDIMDAYKQLADPRGVYGQHSSKKPALRDGYFEHFLVCQEKLVGLITYRIKVIVKA